MRILLSRERGKTDISLTARSGAAADNDNILILCADISRLSFTDDIITNYCNRIQVNERFALYYLSDFSRIEKEAVIKLLSKYGSGRCEAEYIRIDENVLIDLLNKLLQALLKDKDSFFSMIETKCNSIIKEYIKETSKISIDDAEERLIELTYLHLIKNASLNSHRISLKAVKHT